MSEGLELNGREGKMGSMYMAFLDFLIFGIRLREVVSEFIHS